MEKTSKTAKAVKAPKYEHAKIEKKWQAKWAKDKTYETKEGGRKPKAYVLDMFPYPSGDGLHVGHPKGYIATDIYSRFKRMNGFNVLHPMGWDAFGLPAENYAIKNKINPEIAVKKNIKYFKSQVEKIGFDYDWSREVNTTDPKFYKWTQWIFLQLYKKGLAFESSEPINWCPSCKTGLANEDLEGGKCERCGSEVEKKPMRQWILKITDYAERLLADLDALNWPESVKESQRNWIGKSEGSEISFPIKTKYKYVLLHGWKSSSKSCFIPWLKRELEAEGHEVITLDMPNPYLPDVVEQADYVLSKVKFDENTILLGHSLGSVVSYRILEKLKTPIHKLILVAGLIEPKFRDHDRLLAKYLMSWKFDFAKIKKNVGEIVILEDDKDVIIPDGESKVIQQALGGSIYRLEAEKAHFCGTVEPLVLEYCLDKIKVFTTRADTLFGATYLVLAPEHPLVERLAKQIDNIKEVRKYVEKAGKRSEIERSSEGKEKTGIKLEGLSAINPINNQEIPIWVADYVLPDYGTGAIMAVPAHDERDHQFAKKFNLPIKEVIMPSLTDATNPPRKGKEDTFREMVLAILYDPTTKKYLTLKWKSQPWTSFVTGGVEDKENPVEAAKREILEETGYKNVQLIRSLGETEAFFFAAHKDVNRKTHGFHFLFELLNHDQAKISKEEKSLYDPEWLSMEELQKTKLQHAEKDFLLSNIISGKNIYTDEGVLINSNNFSGVESSKAKSAITRLARGKMVTKYKLRDWVFSRQRYWGEPIPIIHCAKCGPVPVPEKDLPVILPKVKSYEPTGTGESPLAAITKWVEVKCPACGEKAKRETNTMPQWAGSSWYYLRFIDPNNTKALVDKKKEKYWSPVDMYVGGTEHATRHLIYARFWHKFLFDIEAVSQIEPFARLKNQGMILGADNRKMSKRWGNVVNPDDIVRDFGADTLRVYEMFMGPFEQGASWSTDNLMGARRFVEKVWRLSGKVSVGPTVRSRFSSEPEMRLRAAGSPEKVLEVLLHKTIKQVTSDIDNFNYNTAISALMILTNEWEKAEGIPAKDWETFLKILAPFAPHLAEELWSNLGKKGSIHTADWPKWDEKKLISDTTTLVIQINGKTRETMTVPTNLSQEEAVRMALNNDIVKKWVGEGKPKKIIYVPNRLLNLVV